VGKLIGAFAGGMDGSLFAGKGGGDFNNATEMITQIYRLSMAGGRSALSAA
jgi:hypothetical protein